MSATLGNVVAQPPALRGPVVGRMLACPPGTPGRKAEGGLRTRGQYKRRKADGAAAPLVTVITVCLNSARTLEQCLRSVAGQTYDNLEHVIVDGCSSDGTLDILQRHAHALDYFVSEPDGGLYQAMNKGLALAAGDYVLILNSDDWYATDCVEALVRAKGYGCADFVAALAQYVDDSGAPVELMRHMPLDDSALMRMPLRHESMLVPAELYERVGGYDESYRIAADFHFVTRLCRAGCTVYELQRPLLYFRNTGVSNSNAALELAERARVIRDGFSFLSQREADTLADVRRLTPAQLVEVATAHADQGELLHALQAYVRYRRRTAPRSHWAECERSWPDAVLPRPRISVILPVYNGERTLQACIESVLAQSFGDFELICLDDLSTDGSWQILADYQAKDSRVVAFRNDANLGHGGARNRGVQLARGAYIFHIDPDDTIPLDALESLYAHALEHGCDVVKGAYWRERQHFEQAGKAASVVNLRRGGSAPAGARLAQMPQLLNSTEGHWSCLYRRDLARQVPYGADLRMGEDSIFVVRALLQAENIGLIDKVVYRYQANASSAMNTFTHRKFMDGVEWRRRAWHVLADAGFKAIGERLLRTYWRDSFFSDFASKADPAQFRELCAKLRAAFAEAGVTSASKQSSAYLRRIFSAILAGQDDEARALMQESAQPQASSAAVRRLRIATFCSLDHGGAGTGSQRRIEALREHGIDARLFSLFVKTREDYVRRVIPELPGIDATRQRDVWEEAKARALLRPGQMPGSHAREMFSLAEGVVDFRTLRELLGHFDVVHLHWMVGMFDYQHGGDVLADKPVAWTLADMNAFTGGCHYSEGCEEYTRECRRCPMLGEDSDLAHRTWKAKRRAYARIKNLHVVCPSPWMAERARKSSLLGDRPIHCIPNAYPVSRLAMTAKAVARLRLGLPLRRKLLLFGAENVTNHRKGGDLLVEAVARFCASGPHDGVEVVVFGRNSLDIGLPVHRMGYINDDETLALVYSAADAYLFPSREDNAPLTVGESLLCGTPVVAFPVGNVPSLVEHQRTGYLARALDVEDFARGIRWVLGATPAAALARSARCRLSAAALHDPAAAAQRHEALYRLALGEAA